MANVIETRILLALTDLLSPGLLKAQQNLSNLNLLHPVFFVVLLRRRLVLLRL